MSASPISIIQIDKVVKSRAVTLAAARGTMSLIERGLTRYGHAWDKPAIAAMCDDKCVGVICLSPDDTDLTVGVLLAWCDPACPEVLTRLLVNLRTWCRNRKITEVFFTAHDDNDDMSKAARVFGASGFSKTYRVAL